MNTELPNRNAILFLGPHEIKGLITMEEAIEAIAQGYEEADVFPIVNAPRRRVHSPDNVRISNFPGGIPGLGVIGSLTRGELITHDEENQSLDYREHPVYLLWNSKTAKLDGIMVGELFDDRTGFTSVMAFRTGATTGVGVDILSRKNSEIFGLFGSGGQAVNKILAINAVRDIKKVKVFSRNPENRVAFCDRMGPMIDKEVIPVESPEEVIKNSDVVITATDSNVPVFDGSLLEPGQHVVTVVGSNSALVEGGWLKSGRRENDDETVRKSDIIVVNHLESVTQEKQAGLYDPIQQGIITEEDIYSLGSVLSGTKPSRTSDEQITYHFNNNGTAAADMALAKIVFDRAKEQGRGTELDIPVPGTQ